MNPTVQRFTIDGSDHLERHLTAVCGRVLEGVQGLLPAAKLHALVLAGGYGRGQGGVLRSKTGDEPYNDIEFYLFMPGMAWLNARRYDARLRALGEHLQSLARVHVEFKIDSLTALRRRTISMFSYDLVARQRIISGEPQVFCGCEHHLLPATIPSLEATRLLLNRCTGLLLAQRILSENATLTNDQADFVGRNLAKLQLALGDAVLTALGQYHWNCLERHRRLCGLKASELLPEFEKIRSAHEHGVEFKLHPTRRNESTQNFRGESQELSATGFNLWMWLESRRLGRAFSTSRDYALSRIEKCRGPNKLCNYLLNLRTFGPRALLATDLGRYPRERLFNALPLLLWYEQAAQEPEVMRRLQQQLLTKACDCSGWISAYKQLWPNYG